MPPGIRHTEHQVTFKIKSKTTLKSLNFLTMPGIYILTIFMSNDGHIVPKKCIGSYMVTVTV